MAWTFRFFIAVFALVLGLHRAARAQDMPLVVIANSKGAPAEMKLAQLKATMRGERLRWPDGSKVVIALMKSSTPIGSSVSKKIYNMGANDLNKFWLALVFQGKADAPNFFGSESELEEFVSQTRGAIGVVNQPAASSKTVAIEGKTSL